jgi:TonB family protein
MTTARSTIFLVLLACLTSARAVAASDETLDRIKDLYRSAAYEQALAALEEPGADPALASSIEAKEYRLLCLIALDRNNDAREAIASILNADPFYQLPQVSPRVRTVFKEMRQSLLPGIVQRAYADAKAAFDRQDPQSTSQFERLLTLLDDPDATAPALADLRTVVSAFRDLSKARGQPVAAPPAAAAAPAAKLESGAGPSAPAAPVVYREGEAGLVFPETLTQTIPHWVLPPRPLNQQALRGTVGSVEVLIDENGNVASVKLLKSLHPTYDAQLVKAAMTWKYRAARKNGTPVRFLKVVNFRVDAD